MEVYGDRLDGPYDMSYWLFSGLFADTAEFGGGFDSSNPAYIGFGDDQDPPNVPGPYGDPHVSFTAPLTGFYTVAVTDFASSGTPPYDFQLTATGASEGGVPEPSSLVLTGIGVALMALRRRKYVAAFCPGGGPPCRPV